MIIREGGLLFTFGKGWIVKKYDQHRYYRGLSGAGLKGVDFICLRDRQELVLIEVKNYTSRHNYAMQKTFLVNTIPPDELALTVQQKLTDTLLAIDAVYQYYRRGWIFRQLQPLIRYWPWSSFDRYFWTKAYQLAQSPTTVKAILWLELDADDPKDYITQLDIQLSRYTNDGLPKIKITNGDNLPFDEAIVAHRILEN
ncbi:MAG: hypothetical protein DHS20C18_01670 [Saprospiraceae bacterium]|nr:MAG: hypothetical protein DHS20C18_01670 [Saprospiraceae bacterium]